MDVIYGELLLDCNILVCIWDTFWVHIMFVSLDLTLTEACNLLFAGIKLLV